MPRAKKTAVAASTESQLTLTPEEVQAILAIRTQQSAPKPAEATPGVAVSDLAAALVTAIEATRPPQKKTVANRKRVNPWNPTGEKKVLLKRRMFQHGLEIDPNQTSNENIEKLNKIRPGVYCNGWVKVSKRRDGGMDISYPVRTIAQRLKLVNTFGVTSFGVLLDRLIAEKADPKAYRAANLDEDGYEIEA